MKTITAQEIARKINASPVWDLADCQALCEMAGLGEEFNSADVDTFEIIVYEASLRLGVDIM